MGAVTVNSLIPITIVGGYLGAGKTTLINEVLKTASGERIFVIVNDFGAINIDSSLIRSRSGEMIELSNGCVCCNVSDDMSAAISKVSSMEPKPDRLVVEVSGVGDPGTLTQWSRFPGFSYGGVVVCVDAGTIREQAEQRWIADTVRKQLDAADLFVLTKGDLFTDETRMADVRRWLGEICADTPALDVGARSAAALLFSVEQPLNAKGHSTEHGSHVEHDTWAGQTEACLDSQAVMQAMSRMPDGVVRAKAIFRTFDSPGHMFVMQKVGRHCEITDAGPWREESLLSRLVVIGIPGALTPDIREVLTEVIAGRYQLSEYPPASHQRTNAVER